MSTTATGDSGITVLVREGWEREHQPLPERRARAEAFFATAFVITAVCLAVFIDASRDLEPSVSAGLVVLFALSIRIQIDIGVSYTSPGQLAVVPMLLLLPTPAVPLLVLLGWLLGRLPDMLGSERIHPDRLLLLPGDCWFVVGPAVVLILGDAQMPDWGKWPVYLLALPAQFGLEAISNVLRERLGDRVPLKLVFRGLLVIWAIDALLSPLGLLAAFASQSFDFAFLLLGPPMILLFFYARERSRRLKSALALIDAANDRDGLIAGASHELITPLGVLVGLTGRLTSGRELPPERRAELDVVMHREVLGLRQIVRQFSDYTRLKTEREPLLRPAATALEPLARDVAKAVADSGTLQVVGPPTLPAAMVDPERAHQMVMSIAAEALEGTDSARLQFDATATTVSVTVTSAAPARQRPFAEGGEGFNAGLGLFVTRELARLQGGDATAQADGRGARYVLTLPRAAQ